VPALFCVAYSFSKLIFPYPYSERVRSFCSFESTIAIPTTESVWVLNLIPVTPFVLLPIGLTSVSLNLTDLPSFVIKIASSEPEVAFTQVNWSPSSNFIAVKPFDLILVNSPNSVFLINPFSVAIKRYLKFFVSSPSAALPSPTTPLGSLVNTEVTISSGSNCTKFTKGNPFAVLPRSGISNILRLKTFPLFVKINSSSWVLHRNACSMKSPSFVSPPFTPLPPLFWAL